ncbi:MAG TPA: hypothetical protein VMC08_03905 [Bacteroidales bacterium]|nr:hypothetical protein [Bacteroidales bacterium]
MKPNDRHAYRLRRIRSLEELKEEKTRLKYEILKSEDEVRRDYRHLVNALTFRNILANLSKEIALTSSVVSKAVEAGRSFFAKRKKKKKKKDSQEGTPPPSEEKQEEELTGP